MASYSQGIYGAVGFCNTLGGAKKATMISAGAGAVVGGLIGWFIVKPVTLDPAEERKIKMRNAAAGAALGGIPLGIGTYFQCRGVEIGIPTASKR